MMRLILVTGWESRDGTELTFVHEFKPLVSYIKVYYCGLRPFPSLS